MRSGTFIPDMQLDPDSLEITRYWVAGPGERISYPSTETSSHHFKDLAEVEQFLKDVQRFAGKYRRKHG